MISVCLCSGVGIFSGPWEIHIFKQDKLRGRYIWTTDTATRTQLVKRIYIHIYHVITIYNLFHDSFPCFCLFLTLE